MNVIKPYLIFLSLYVLLPTSSVFADSYTIDYTIILDATYLLGQDTQNVIVHNGKFARKLKLINGVTNSISISYFVPCFSGRSMTTEERVEEMLIWNGSHYNIYYESAKMLISVPAVTIDLFKDRIKSDSVYLIPFTQSTPTEQDLNQFRAIYLKFMNLKAIVNLKGLESVIENPIFAKDIIRHYLPMFRLRDFSLGELENIFKMALPKESSVEIFGYLDGIRKLTIKFNMSSMSLINYNVNYK